jgi:hypothetical protein
LPADNPELPINEFPKMNRPHVSALCLSLLLGLAAGAGAAEPQKKPAAKPAAKTKAKAPAKKAEPAPAPDEPLNEGQLAAAQRVLTGRADCEYKQAVDVEPAAGQPGHFDVRFGKQTYHMVPEETTTGAVRLHDKRADVVWLQIPVKSMMMDQKAGRRLVDGCQHPQQRAAVEAVEQARVAATAANVAASAAGNAATAATAAAAQPATAMAASAAEKAAAAASAAAAAASAAIPGNTIGVGQPTAPKQ